MKKALRTVSLLLTMLLALSVFPMVLHADEPFSGSGTVDDPYIIATPADFAALTDLFNASTSSSAPYGAGMYFKQTADIDMTGYTGYEGTHAGDGSVGKLYFGGIYNGAGHTLTVNIDATGQTSIFPYITGVILNLKFAGSVTATSSTQPIRTIQAGAVLANVVFETTIVSTGGAGCGVAYSQYGTLFNVFVTGVVTGAASSKAVYYTNSGGSYYHVFTNVTKSTDGSALTHSTCTASNDLDAIAAAFNNREDSAFQSGLSALTMACMDMTEDALGTVTVENGVIVLSDGTLGGGSLPTLSGSGTAADPYLIATSEDFKIFTDFMNASTSESAAYGAGEYFLQTADIDMTGVQGYDGTHVLNNSRKVYFGGIYDGAGHTINVDITSEGQTSVFPYITGAIFNLKITGSIDSGAASSTTSAQPVRAVQAGSVLANCVFEMTLKASKGNGVTYSLYGTVFNVFTTGVASAKAVYQTNTGKVYNVFTDVVNESGTALTHSTTTASNDLDAIAAAFNDRSSEDFTAGIAALTAVDATLSADSLMPVYNDGTKIVFGTAPVQPLKGDLDGNGAIDISDVSILLNVIATSGYEAAGDMDDNGTLNITDVTGILNVLAGGGSGSAMEDSYATARQEFYEVTGVLLPELSGVEADDFPYTPGDTGYCLDLTFGSELSYGTFETLKAFLDSELASWTISESIDGPYTNVNYNSDAGWIGLTWDADNAAVYVNASMN